MWDMKKHDAPVEDILPIYYSSDYTLAGHSFDTTRKAAWVADSLRDDPIRGVSFVEPTPLTKEQLLAVHWQDYVEAVETGEPRGLAQSQGFAWDPQLWHMVCTSNGGVVDAALDAWKHRRVTGSLSSGIHHARYQHGMGFCTFNGLALAAHAALTAGARSLLILDLDAHCGGGTQSLLKGDARIWHLDISVSPADHYMESSRFWVRVVRDSARYLSEIKAGLSRLEEKAPLFDLCLYNAGMDPCESCDIGGITGITPEILAEREQIVFEWLRRREIPAAFVLAGGYIGHDLDRAGLVALHRLTVSAALRPRDGGQNLGFHTRDNLCP